MLFFSYLRAYVLAVGVFLWIRARVYVLFSFDSLAMRLFMYFLTADFSLMTRTNILAPQGKLRNENNVSTFKVKSLSLGRLLKAHLWLFVSLTSCEFN